MKVACLVPSLKRKGPVILALDVARSVRKDIDVYDVFYFDEAEDCIDISDYPGIEFKKIGFFDKNRFIGYDILHSHSLRPDLYTFLFRKSIRPKIISTIHNYVKEELSYTYNSLISYVFSKIWILTWKNKDGIVFLSNDMQYYYKSLNFYPSFSSVIYNGRAIASEKNNLMSEEDNKELKEINLLKKNHLVLGACGFLNKRKGFKDVINFLTLDQMTIALILGDGPELTELENYAKILKVEKRCFFLGFKKNIEEWIKLLDVYIMSSYSEGFPLVMLEASSLKVPILSVKSSLFNEIYSNEEVVFYSRGNEGEMKDALKEIKDNLEAYSNAVYLGTKKRYSLEQLGHKYFNFYKKISQN
jgi:hypothetical protein